MRISSFVSFVGFVMVFVATFCPIAHFIINQNAYQCNQPYGLILLLVAVVGIIGTVFNNVKLTKLIAWILVGLVIVFYIAALFKIHNYFNFIPFHTISGYLSGKIKFRWGWYLMCIGAILALAGTFFQKQNNFIPNN